LKDVSEFLGNRIRYIAFPPAVWVCMTIVFVIVAALSTNEYLTFASLICLPFFATLLWRIGEPPVLFFAVCFQWLQASIKIFDANARGMTLQDFYSGWRIDDAIWLSLIGLVVLSIGMRIALRGFTEDRSLNLTKEVETLSIQKIWCAYVAFTLFSFLLQEFTWMLPRARQAINVLLNIKWIIFFMLSMTVIGQSKNYYFLIIAVVIELVIGFTAFFSEFKQVFFVLALASLTFIRIFTKKVLIVSLFSIIVVGFLLIVWGAVKKDYREVVNLGTGTQAVLAPFQVRFDKIIELYKNVDETTLKEGLEAFASRVAYVDYFARVMERVPENIPYEDGKQWGAAIGHVMRPRLFFPDKSALPSDTLVTEKYTGYMLVLQGGEHTNVPLGYMTESYIDFGPVYMFVPLFIVGLCWGLIYRYFMNTNNEVLLSYGIAVAVLIHANQLEISLAKMLGGILAGFLVMAIVKKFLVPALHRSFVIKEGLV